MVKFGLLTDTHYAHRPMKIGRYYEKSLDKIKRYLPLFKEEDVAFLVHLGDVADDPNDPVRGLADVQELTNYLQTLQVPVHYVFGNHDVDSVPKETLSQLWSYPAERSYYSFAREGVRCIILDSNFDEYGNPYSMGNTIWDDCYLGKEQLNWLKDEIDGAKEERIFVLVHALLDDFEDPHRIKNAAAVRSLLEASQKPVTVFQGHMHSGRMSEKNGILYYTLPATVEGIEDYHCTVVTAGDEQVIIKTYRREGISEFSWPRNIEQ